MGNKKIVLAMQVGILIFFLSALWSLFMNNDRAMFIAELQTGLLFLIISLILKRDRLQK